MVGVTQRVVDDVSWKSTGVQQGGAVLRVLVERWMDFVVIIMDETDKPQRSGSSPDFTAYSRMAVSATRQWRLQTLTLDELANEIPSVFSCLVQSSELPSMASSNCRNPKRSAWHRQMSRTCTGAPIASW